MTFCSPSIVLHFLHQAGQEMPRTCNDFASIVMGVAGWGRVGASVFLSLCNLGYVPQLALSGSAIQVNMKRFDVEPAEALRESIWL